MATLVKLSDGSTNTRNLLSDTSLRFAIRPPQRRYRWTDKEVVQLWDDIKRAHESNRASYFLGTLLLVPLSDDIGLSVIDGQQRITTLSILLAVLRDRCQALLNI